MAVDIHSLRIDRDALDRRRRPWGLLALVGLALAVSVGAWAWGRAGRAPTPMPAPTTAPTGRAVRTVQIAAPGAGSTVVGGGWVEAAPPAPIVVAARVAGTIQELPVLQGDAVAAGAVCARIDPTPFQLGRDRAAADHAVAARRLETLQAGTRPEEIRRAEAAARAAASEVTRTAKALARAKELAPGGAVSQAALERAEADAARAVADRDAAEAELALLRAGTRPEAIAEAEAALAVAAADLARAEQELAWTAIRAPRAGTVLQLFVHVGEHVNPDRAGEHGAGSVLALYDPNDLQVRVDLPQAEAALVAVGQATQISLAAAPGRSFGGEVVRIDPLGDLAKNTVRVRVRVLETDPALRPDLTARVAFADHSDAPGTLRIPARCVVQGGDGPAVWALRSGVAQRIRVTLGVATGPEVVVESGLRGGETLVLDPPGDLAEGEALAATGGA